MGIFSRKNKQGNFSVNLSFENGVEGFNKGYAVELSIDNENNCFVLRSRILKTTPLVNIRFDSVVDIGCVSEKEIIEKSKSVGGRAVVGGLLLGPLGAVVGGMSGINNKKITKSKTFLVINYKTSEGEIKPISFAVVGATLNLAAFIIEAKSKLKIEDNKVITL